MSNPVVEHSIDLQVAALQAEVERLKAIPMKYRRLEFNAQLQNENDELRNRIEELERKVASRDAEVAELVAALERLADYVDERSGDNECRPLENAKAALAKVRKP